MERDTDEEGHRAFDAEEAALEARREQRRQIVRRHYDRNRANILERKKAQREARRDGATQRPLGRPRLERGAPSSGPFCAAPPTEGGQDGASDGR